MVKAEPMSGLESGPQFRFSAWGSKSHMEYEENMASPLSTDEDSTNPSHSANEELYDDRDDNERKHRAVGACDNAPKKRRFRLFSKRANVNESQPAILDNGISESRSDWNLGVDDDAVEAANIVRMELEGMGWNLAQGSFFTKGGSEDSDEARDKYKPGSPSREKGWSYRSRTMPDLQTSPSSMTEGSVQYEPTYPHFRDPLIEARSGYQCSVPAQAKGRFDPSRSQYDPVLAQRERERCGPGQRNTTNSKKRQTAPRAQILKPVMSAKPQTMPLLSNNTHGVAQSVATSATQPHSSTTTIASTGTPVNSNQPTLIKNIAHPVVIPVESNAPIASLSISTVNNAIENGEISAACSEVEVPTSNVGQAKKSQVPSERTDESTVTGDTSGTVVMSESSKETAKIGTLKPKQAGKGVQEGPRVESALPPLKNPRRGFFRFLGKSSKAVVENNPSSLRPSTPPVEEEMAVEEESAVDFTTLISVPTEESEAMTIADHASVFTATIMSWLGTSNHTSPTAAKTFDNESVAAASAAVSVDTRNREAYSMTNSICDNGSVTPTAASSHATKSQRSYSKAMAASEDDSIMATTAASSLPTRSRNMHSKTMAASDDDSIMATTAASSLPTRSRNIHSKTMAASEDDSIMATTAASSHATKSRNMHSKTMVTSEDNSIMATTAASSHATKSRNMHSKTMAASDDDSIMATTAASSHATKSRNMHSKNMVTSEDNSIMTTTAASSHATKSRNMHSKTMVTSDHESVMAATAASSYAPSIHTAPTAAMTTSDKSSVMGASRGTSLGSRSRSTRSAAVRTSGNAASNRTGLTATMTLSDHGSVTEASAMSSVATKSLTVHSKAMTTSDHGSETAESKMSTRSRTTRSTSKAAPEKDIRESGAKSPVGMAADVAELCQNETMGSVESEESESLPPKRRFFGRRKKVSVPFKRGKPTASTKQFVAAPASVQSQPSVASAEQSKTSSQSSKKSAQAKSLSSSGRSVGRTRGFLARKRGTELPTLDESAPNLTSCLRNPRSSGLATKSPSSIGPCRSMETASTGVKEKFFLLHQLSLASTSADTDDESKPTKKMDVEPRNSAAFRQYKHDESDNLSPQGQKRRVAFTEDDEVHEFSCSPLWFPGLVDGSNACGSTQIMSKKQAAMSDWDDLMNAFRIVTRDGASLDGFDDETMPSISDATIDDVRSAASVLKVYADKLGIREEELMMALEDEEASTRRDNGSVQYRGRVDNDGMSVYSGGFFEALIDFLDGPSVASRPRRNVQRNF